MLNRTKLKLLPNESNISFLLVILVIINLKLVYYPTRDVGNSGEFQNLICPPIAGVVWWWSGCTALLGPRTRATISQMPPPHNSYPRSPLSTNSTSTTSAPYRPPGAGGDFFLIWVLSQLGWDQAKALTGIYSEWELLRPSELTAQWWGNKA